MIKLKDLLLEASQIKKVKNVSVQYMDAEYQGETLHGFKYFKKGPWLYKKDNGEYFAVVITNKNNRYEIQLGNKPKNNMQATAAVEKIIKKNLNKFESVNEGKVTYKFKGFTNTQMDELDAMLYRAGVRGTPDFNKRTYTVNLKGSNTFTLDKIMKGKGGKKIKEGINEGKANMNLYKKVVKALKDIPVRASIHLDNDGDLSINLGMYYFEKKNPEGTGDLSDMVEDRLQKAGIRKGYGSLGKQGISIQASTSHLDDKRYTKAQHDIRGGI